ncbi:DUF1398 domain-containing protein [Mucilaginibacter pedocola]|uniref:Phage envelope protein n=1 Tax=Mucilaginibacter pedocola TaxID=1792845 RepID=A0A1S9PBH1_9SPHI|nr:DUF1398 family protein [Mucilaginibacter pedocola]OOQ58261.1 phage envelope protein [Mucilaginibacter pedocola]
MFTLQQLKAAHSKVKTGADFPAYIQEIKQLGLITYEYWVADGHTIYYGEGGHRVSSPAIYESLQIASSSSADALRNTITIHQQGQTDFITFCKQASDAGVEKWVIDTQKMLCIYYDAAGSQMVAEPIPQLGYQF